VAIRIEFTGFVNEVKQFEWGTVYRMSHNQQQKNDQGQWETTGRDYFDVIGPAGFVESNRVTVKGTLKTKTYEKKDGTGKGIVLQVRAESMEHAVSNNPSPVQPAPNPVQQVWPEVAEMGNAPF
jgi:hypothetical protein